MALGGSEAQNEARHGRQGKVQSIQLLRAIAAITVAATHLAYGFADHVGAGLGLPPSDGQAAQVAVALFFLVSGYVMVVSSARLFGRKGAAREFIIRRLVRIYPSYWIATCAMLALPLWLGERFGAGELLQSFLLLPYWGEAGQHWPLPLLWPGWTLTYELLFYLLFALGISAGRKQAVGFAALAIAVLVTAGLVLEPASAAAFVATRGVLLLFVAGMILALWRGQARALPIWLRLVLVAGAPLVFVLAPGSEASPLGGAAYLLWAGLPALLLFAAAAGGPLAVPRFAIADRLGDASYAIYLLHVPIGQAWPYFYPGRLFELGPWIYLAAMLAGTVAAALLFYRFVERPLIGWLNARLLKHPPRVAMLQQTGI